MSKVILRNRETRAMSTRKGTHSSANRSVSAARLSWKLASGESLAEFALRFGFLAPRLLGQAGSRVPELIRLPEVR
jgi:hypothetical protein